MYNIYWDHAQVDTAPTYEKAVEIWQIHFFKCRDGENAAINRNDGFIMIDAKIICGRGKR